MSDSVNNRLLRALRREPVDRTPVWIMRQAGRYLPEYREVRRKAGSFLALCTTPELACEVTLQPLARFELDAAILFSDILTVPGAMGLGLDFAEGEGPRFRNRIKGASDVSRLPQPDPEQDLGYVMETVRLVSRELDGRVPLIGFAGSPWTLATYMVEGGGSASFAKAKTLLYSEPEVMHQLLDHLTRSVTEYLRAQVAAGVDALMLFDTWGGVLTPSDYRAFSLAYMARVVADVADGLAEPVPIVLFTKGGGAWLEAIAETGCQALGLDWTVDLGDARRRVGHRVALQGNLDPAMLRAPASRIRDAVGELLASFGSGPGHVMNLGHGIQPDMDPDHVAAFVDAVHELSPGYH